MSYNASEAAKLAAQLEADIEHLEEEKYIEEINERSFIKHHELQALQRRQEKQLVKANEYAKDMIATFQLISRIIEIENSRTAKSNKNRLVANGEIEDVQLAMRCLSTDSELLQLSLICDDAEFYPDMHDELKKTSAIVKRSQKLSQILMRKGYTPHLLMLNEDQQLIAANAMMRQMAQIADPDDNLEGFKKAVNYLELGEYLEDVGLLQKGVNTLKKHSALSVLEFSERRLINKEAEEELENAR
jgi:hypothetical protein